MKRKSREKRFRFACSSRTVARRFRLPTTSYCCGVYARTSSDRKTLFSPVVGESAVRAPITTSINQRFSITSRELQSNNFFVHFFFRPVIYCLSECVTKRENRLSTVIFIFHPGSFAFYVNIS